MLRLLCAIRASTDLEMSNVNKVILIGRVGRDPEVRYTANGAAIANLSVATSRSWKDKNSGEKKEETEWHRVSMFDKLAEITGEYVKKGALVYIEGSLKTRKWTDKDGVEKYTTEIRADVMQMLGGKADGERGPAPAPRAAPAGKTGFDDMDDDIPY